MRSPSCTDRTATSGTEGRIFVGSTMACPTRATRTGCTLRQTSASGSGAAGRRTRRLTTSGVWEGCARTGAGRARVPKAARPARASRREILRVMAHLT